MLFISKNLFFNHIHYICDIIDNKYLNEKKYDKRRKRYKILCSM